MRADMLVSVVLSKQGLSSIMLGGGKERGMEPTLVGSWA